MREAHVCGNENVQLINLQHHIGRHAEAKCVTVNHRRPEQLAVGASDAYARIYDRRMIRAVRVSSTQFPFRIFGKFLHIVVEWEVYAHTNSCLL